MNGQSTEFDKTSYLYTRFEGQVKRAQTNFKANFAVTKNIKTLFNSKAAPDRSYIEIGDTPSAKMLNSLEIAPLPFQFRYAEHMTSCFDLSDSEMPAWAKV